MTYTYIRNVVHFASSLCRKVHLRSKIKKVCQYVVATVQGTLYMLALTYLWITCQMSLGVTLDYIGTILFTKPTYNYPMLHILGQPSLLFFAIIHLKTQIYSLVQIVSTSFHQSFTQYNFKNIFLMFLKCQYDCKRSFSLLKKSIFLTILIIIVNQKFHKYLNTSLLFR